MRIRVVLAHALVLIGGMVWLSGCGSSNTNPFGRDPQVTRDGQAWVAVPVAVRIHPSTRFVTRGETATLDTRIELIDRFGDPIKYSASYRFELWSGGLAGTGQSMIQSWTREVRSYEDHGRHYEPVTRSYWWSLQVRSDPSGLTRPRLRVYVQAEGSDRIRAEVGLRAE